MRLKSLNGYKVKKYGFPEAMEYENEHFHGHQIGITAGILNEDGSVYASYTRPEDVEADKNEMLLEMVNTEGIRLLESENTVIDSQLGPVKRTTVYVPYACIDSSAFKPTINYDCTEDLDTSKSVMEVEILICRDGLNRYIVVSQDVKHQGPLDIANAFILDDEWLQSVGFSKVEGEWAIDMYNEAGEAFEVRLGKENKDLSKWVNSVRLIGIQTFEEEQNTE